VEGIGYDEDDPSAIHVGLLLGGQGIENAFELSLTRRFVSSGNNGIKYIITTLTFCARLRPGVLETSPAPARPVPVERGNQV